MTTSTDITTASKGSIGMYLEDDNNGGGEVAKIEWRHDGTDGSLEGKGTLSFWTSNTGGVDGVPEERMTIRASGNVGIGTSTPTSKLHVVGDTRITGNLLMGGTAQDGTPSKIQILKKIQVTKIGFHKTFATHARSHWTWKNPI